MVRPVADATQDARTGAGVNAALWTILVPTIGERAPLLRRLLDVLLPQLDEHAGDVRVLAWHNNGLPSLGEIRDLLVRGADSEYVSFVDDDDLVPEYYVAEVVQALATRPDHVGFQLEYTTNGIGREIVEHSIAHGRWHRTAEGVLARDLTHIDPIRRDLALRGTFVTRRRNRAEDRHWVKQVRVHVASEVYINKVMYHYLWREDTTAWQRPESLYGGAGRLVVDHPHFAWHPECDR
jgi:hypothetical protein